MLFGNLQWYVAALSNQNNEIEEYLPGYLAISLSVGADKIKYRFCHRVKGDMVICIEHDGMTFMWIMT